MIQVRTFSVGQLAANCYVLSDDASHDALIIDPGDESEFISDQLQKYKLTPKFIVATHGHFDHIMAGYALSLNYMIPFGIHPGDAFLVDRMGETAQYFLGHKQIDPPPKIDMHLVPGSTLPIGDDYVEIIATPGHTPGGVTFVHKKSRSLIVGDTVFADGALGRTDHTYSDKKLFQETIKTILGFSDAWHIYPGHGVPTTVALAKAAIGV